MCAGYKSKIRSLTLFKTHGRSVDEADKYIGTPGVHWGSSGTTTDHNPKEKKTSMVVNLLSLEGTSQDNRQSSRDWKIVAAVVATETDPECSNSPES